MIALLTGTILSVQPNSIIVHHNNIGFEIQTPHAASYAPEQTVKIYTHMHWNQEQGPTLFGFTSELEKATFLLIISVSGIGPRIALTVLQQLDATLFLQAVSQEDIKTISSINGIGPKKAEQLCVALKHKITKLLDQHPDLAQTTNLGIWKDLQDTLQSLHYSTAEIKQTTSHLQQQQIESVSFDVLLRKALAHLTRQ